jgi:hypothetical protein
LQRFGRVTYRQHPFGRAAATRKKDADPLCKAVRDKVGERGIMDMIGIIGYCDRVSMTLITMQAGAPNDSAPPLPVLEIRSCRNKCALSGRVSLRAHQRR